MKRLAYIAMSGFLLSSGPVLAQNEQDALQLSREEVTGSARSISMGGAFAALGGDVSGAFINPAGIAVFRNNEFSLGAAFHTNVNEATYYGRTSLDSKSNFNIPSLSIVGVNNLKGSKWRSTSLAFGMHRNYSFHRRYNYTGNDVPSSLIDSYLTTISEKNISPSELESYPFDLFLAWQTYVLDTIGGFYYNATGVLPVDQSFQMEESGAKRETYFSFGGNYDDKLYVGANVNFSRISLERSYTHTENINPDDSLTVLRQFNYSLFEEFSGLGASFSAGLIYRPINALRIGMSFRSPTVYSLDLEYESSMNATYTENRVFDQQSPYLGQYRFRLTSPTQATLGLAYVIGKKGLISADLEYVNYTGIRMRGLTNVDNFNDAEDAIRSNLQSALNLKFGAEYRLTNMWSLRAGFAHFGDPHQASLIDEGAFQLYSGGFGYRTKEFFIDAAYQLKSSESIRFLYNPNLVDEATINGLDHRFTATFGFKF